MNRFIFAVLAASLPMLSSAQTIETYTGWAGVSEHITGFGGAGNNTAFGQSFTVVSPSILLSYQSAMILDSGTVFDVRLYISSWDPTAKTTIGAPLYTSGLLTMPAVVGTTLDLGASPNLALPAGTYIAFYSTIGADISTSGVGGVGTQYAGGKYAGGDFFAAVDTTLTGLETNPWFTFSPGNDYDTVFRAEFQAVPEPASLAVLGLGLAALRRHRRG